MPQPVGKNPAVYALLSAVLVGLGSLLAGRPIRAVVYFCSVWFFALMVLLPFVGLLFVPAWMAVYTLNIVDGYRSAQRWNRRRGLSP